MDPTIGAWLTPLEAANTVRIHVSVLRRAMHTRGLKYAKLGHRTIRIHSDWLREWLNKQASTVK